MPPRALTHFPGKADTPPPQPGEGLTLGPWRRMPGEGEVGVRRNRSHYFEHRYLSGSWQEPRGAAKAAGSPSSSRRSNTEMEEEDENGFLLFAPTRGSRLTYNTGSGRWAQHTSTAGPAAEWSPKAGGAEYVCALLTAWLHMTEAKRDQHL
ncbi:unnamed protein product [Rangifer tarandus platyrhynchus]|uniref:WW domain-containing protein n=2 Tax=Rangifer tarandus platyrhynchus TaxID=3082113 RepID=A0ABN8YE91_RANTA|nr:unnamed protein product [Rangifer tarandus platyrhynchus]CAI9700187.1 unnamed protein product [Rangifer tarandus platyrhynchus]